VVGNGDRLGQRRLRQRDDEVLAAIARRDVLSLDVLLHRHGNEAQDLVAGHLP